MRFHDFYRTLRQQELDRLGMNHFQPAPEEMFTLRDLGVFETKPCEVLDRLTAWGERFCSGTGCVLFLRDIESRRVILRSAGPRARGRLLRTRHILSGSLTDRVCEDGDVVTDADPMSWSPTMPEIADFGATSFVAAPVTGPGGDKIGIVALMGEKRAIPTAQAIADVEGLAMIVSQRILLKASLATLQRIAKDREMIGSPPRHKH
jgi:hypothetical protein